MYTKVPLNKLEYYEKERNVRFPQQLNPTKKDKNQPPKTQSTWLIKEAVMSEMSAFNGVTKSAGGAG